jgi:hypothetical protein
MNPLSQGCARLTLQLTLRVLFQEISAHRKSGPELLKRSHRARRYWQTSGAVLYFVLDLAMSDSDRRGGVLKRPVMLQ